ncbi:RNA polymerase II subunit A C-terminal domain phosphatase, partial [Tremellales sp. Uapishka_1]
KPVLYVQQPCTHPVQIHGLCGICGADITEDDYLSGSRSGNNEAGPSKYPGGFEIAHDALGVTVSNDEAKRLENLSRDTLLSTRRLSLIVDLDQTIIHTTVDPTVGEWMSEIQQEESTTPTTTPPGSPKRESESKKKNPNADALRDVARFHLEDELPPGTVMASHVQGVERWYYTKPRPGLDKFLTDMSELYEMHVYTMGTRSYADAICGVIDPEGKIFGGRILSRDESGSMSEKNLKRLFPTDTSMVVVIDDRADVWGDCPNLVKVIPYDFFVGIGDINGSFLPPTMATLPAGPGLPLVSSTSDSPSSTTSTLSLLTPPDSPSTSTEEGLLLQTKLLDQVSEDRPLAKLQEKLEKEDEAEAENGVSAESTIAPASEGTEVPVSPEASRRRRQLLNDADNELKRIRKARLGLLPRDSMS